MRHFGSSSGVIALLLLTTGLLISDLIHTKEGQGGGGVKFSSSSSSRCLIAADALCEPTLTDLSVSMREPTNGDIFVAMVFVERTKMAYQILSTQVFAFNYEEGGSTPSWGANGPTKIGGGGLELAPVEEATKLYMEAEAGLVGGKLNSRYGDDLLYISNRGGQQVVTIHLLGDTPTTTIANNYAASTVVGNGMNGCAGGVGTAARVSDPRGLVWVDKEQTVLLVALGNCHRLAKVTSPSSSSTAQMSFVLGTGASGESGGFGTHAELNSPSSVASWRDRIYVYNEGSSALFAVYPRKHWQATVVVDGNTAGTRTSNTLFKVGSFGLDGSDEGFNSISTWTDVCWLVLVQSRSSTTHLVDPTGNRHRKVSLNSAYENESAGRAFLLEEPVGAQKWAWTTLDPLGRLWVALDQRRQMSVYTVNTSSCPTPNPESCSWKSSFPSDTTTSSSNAQVLESSSSHESFSTSTTEVPWVREVVPAGVAIAPSSFSSSADFAFDKAIISQGSKCQVRPVVDGTRADMVAVGGVTPITVTTAGWGNDGMTYDFGYYLLQEQEAPSTTATAAASSSYQQQVPVSVASGRVDGFYTFTAPMPGVGATSVMFVVKAFNRDGADAGRATCELVLSRPENLRALRETHYLLLLGASTTGNITSVLTIAQHTAGLTDSFTTGEERETLKTNVITALVSTLAVDGNPAASSSSFLTKQTRSAIVQVLSRVCQETQNTHNSSTEEREEGVIYLVGLLLNATSVSDIDTANQAGDFLVVIDHIHEKAAIRDSTSRLAKACGANLAVGDDQTVRGDKYTLSASKRVAKYYYDEEGENLDAAASGGGGRGGIVLQGGGRIFNGGRIQMTIPSALVEAIPNVTEGTEVSISAVDYLENPWPTTTTTTVLPTTAFVSKRRQLERDSTSTSSSSSRIYQEMRTVLKSQVTEIAVQADGKDVIVENLATSDPIKILITLLQEGEEELVSHLTNNDPYGGCRYYNTTTQTWSTSGLVATSGGAHYNSTHAMCYTTHLTMFATEGTSATGETEEDGFGQAITLVLISGAILLVSLFGVATYLCCRKKKKNVGKTIPQKKSTVPPAVRRTYGGWVGAPSSTTSNSERNSLSTVSAGPSQGSDADVVYYPSSFSTSPNDNDNSGHQPTKDTTTVMQILPDLPEVHGGGEGDEFPTTNPLDLLEEGACKTAWVPIDSDDE